MTKQEIEKLLDKVKDNYVFYKEAIKILEEKYTYGSAREKLTKLTQAGKVEKIELFNVPTLYKKKDVLTVVRD